MQIFAAPDGTCSVPASATSTQVHSHDVTGGMSAKLRTALAIARMGIPVCIAQAATEDAAVALRAEEPSRCTRIVLQ